MLTGMRPALINGGLTAINVALALNFNSTANWIGALITAFCAGFCFAIYLQERVGS